MIIIINKIMRHPKKRNHACGCPSAGAPCWQRRTEARNIVLTVLADNQAHGHLAADEIFFQAKISQATIGLATVYRTLESLRQSSIVSALDPGDGRMRYELKQEGPAGHHHHLICQSCQRIIDYNDFENEEIRLVKKTQVHLAKQYGYKIVDHSIEFIGVCPDCQKVGPDGNA
jgi:Fur family transcriptional regulator, ferric uptake regulator